MITLTLELNVFLLLLQSTGIEPVYGWVTVASSETWFARKVAGIDTWLGNIVNILQRQMQLNFHSTQQLIFCFRLKAVRFPQRFQILIQCIYRDTTVKAKQQAPLLGSSTLIKLNHPSS